jgi:hypothetical protein
MSTMDDPFCIDIKPDIYKFQDNLFYFTNDPLDVTKFYSKELTPHIKKVHYGNMRHLDKAKYSIMITQSEPLNIGWVPVEYHFAEHHPELFL